MLLSLLHQKSGTVCTTKLKASCSIQNQFTPEVWHSSLLSCRGTWFSLEQATQGSMPLMRYAGRRFGYRQRTFLVKTEVLQYVFIGPKVCHDYKRSRLFSLLPQEQLEAADRFFRYSVMRLSYTQRSMENPFSSWAISYGAKEHYWSISPSSSTTQNSFRHLPLSSTTLFGVVFNDVLRLGFLALFPKSKNVFQKSDLSKMCSTEVGSIAFHASLQLGPFPTIPQWKSIRWSSQFVNAKGQLTAMLLDPPFPTSNQEFPAKVRITSDCVCHFLKSPGAMFVWASL